MNPMMVLSLIKFTLSSGPSIVAQCDALVNFATDLLANFNAENAEPVVEGEAGIMQADAKVDRFLNAHPLVGAACYNFADFSKFATASADVRPAGVFRDFLRVIADNPQKYIDLFLLFRDLFAGAEAGNTSTTAAE